MNIVYALTEVLARDISLLGGFKAPLLSWLGSAGLMLFFGWQGARLLVEVRRASDPFVELRPLLAALAERVEALDIRHTYDRAFGDRREAPPRGEPSAEGATDTDVDRLHELDDAMRETGAFRRPWGQFRKTLLVEHVPWFKEPRVFSTRRAEEFFTQEAVLGSRIDLTFYGQVPSLITGLGLLLTFVAICIGLSRLHAEGQTVTGIQGLINGLAGKFLTSIVGLVCANLFILLERPAVRRLRVLHEEFLVLLDESFQRRTVEDLLDALGRHRPLREAAPRDGRREDRARGINESLGAPIDELTAAIRTLSQRIHEPREMAHSLTAAVEALEASQSRVQAQLAALVDRLAALPAPAPAADPAPRGGARRLRAAASAGQRGEADEAASRPARWEWARQRGWRLG